VAGDKAIDPKVNIPKPELAAEQLFPSMQSLYETARSSFFKVLRSFRKARVRSARGSKRRSIVSSQTTGRNIRTVSYSKGRGPLAPLPTIVRAASCGHCDLVHNKLTITERDMVAWKRVEYESLTLILLVDVSKSAWPFIKVFKEILRSLTHYFGKHNDRIGLISLQGLQARIYSHPSHNFRVVARGLSRLRFHGHTPLADGLTKALTMAKLEKSKNSGSRCVVILLSDCYPEPLTPGYDDIFDDPAYRNSINAAKPYRRAGVNLLVINPAFFSPEGKMPGEVLSRRICDEAGGKLLVLYRPRDKRDRAPSKKELDSIMRGIEASFLRPASSQFGQKEQGAGPSLNI